MTYLRIIKKGDKSKIYNEDIYDLWAFTSHSWHEHL